MSELLEISTRSSLDGRILSDGFSHSFLIRTADTVTPDAIYTWLGEYRTLLVPILDQRIELYSIRASKVVTPGLRKKTRNDHITRYVSDIGSNGATGADPALLPVVAHFYKFPTVGTAGDLLIRGVLTETQLASSEGGDPEDAAPTTGKVRFETFASGLLTLIATLGGAKLVMPLRKRDEFGKIITTDLYTSEAREVKKVEFAGFTQRQLHKNPQSITGKTTDLLRRMVARLHDVYNNAVADNGGTANGLPVETINTFKELGQEIYKKFTAAERLKVKVEPEVKAYIKDWQI